MSIYKLDCWLPDSTMVDNDKHVDLLHKDHQEIVQQHCDFLLKSPEILVSPKKVDLRANCSPIHDQGPIGSCVGQGIVGALEYLQIRNGLVYVALSELFPYYNSRLMTKNQNEDSGTFIRLAMGTLSSIGTCSAAKWPYDVNAVFTRPSWGAYREAYANKIDAYYAIKSTGLTRRNEIKLALLQQHVVVFGMTVDNAFCNYKGGIMPLPKEPRPGRGGHCEVIVGFDDGIQCWIVRNSWGVMWGEAGYAYVPYKYLDMSDANDFWVPTLSPVII